jgi:SAM-dependent methyltransferase
MDFNATSQYLRYWAFQPVPMRPSPTGLANYGRAIKASVQSDLLIYGGTPELVDLAMQLGVPRTTRVDLSQQILDGMQPLARRKWQRVESLVADWLSPVAEWDGQFDAILCDGGTIFLSFPVQWSQFFEQSWRRLRPGGRLVFKSQAHPVDAPNFETVFERKIELFRSCSSALSSDKQTTAFWHLCGWIWQASHFGCVDESGQIDKAAVKSQMDAAAGKLMGAFPQSKFLEIVRIELTENFRNADGTTVLECLTPAELATPLLTVAGFEVESLEFLADSEPVENYCWQVTAVKSA